MNWKEAVPEWNRNWIVQEINDDRTVERQPDRKTWRFHMESFPYRQKVSFDAFFFGYSRKDGEILFPRRNWKTKDLFYHPKHEYEFVQIEHPVREAGPIGDILREFDQKAEREWNSAIDIYSLWDFYEMIGYDRKTKKYA